MATAPAGGAAPPAAPAPPARPGLVTVALRNPLAVELAAGARAVATAGGSAAAAFAAKPGQAAALACGYAAWCVARGGVG
jgi:hypothetical protein